MAGSVAGQIRIDLLANAARFKADMREAGREGLGGFQDEFNRVVRGFDAPKQLAARIQNAKDSWQVAMKSLRDEIKGDRTGADARDTMLRWYGVERMNPGGDLATQARIRARSYLPWGMTLRSEMSREAALTAAAIAENKQTIVKSLSAATREIAGQAAYSGGLGGVAATLGKFAMGHPLLVGAGLLAGGVLKTAFDRDELARNTDREAGILGQGVGDTSRMRAVGFDQPTLSRFQRSLSERSPEGLRAFASLGVNPEQIGAKPLLAALTDVASGFEKIKNPADRANVAMALFGKSGAEMIGTLGGMKEKLDQLGEYEIIKPEDVARVKAWDNAKKGARNTFSQGSLSLGRLLGSESGFGTHMARSVESLKYLLTGDMAGLDRVQFRHREEDFRTTNAAQLEKTKESQAKLADDGERYAKGMEKARDVLKSLAGQLLDLRQGEGAAARQAFLADAEKTWREGGKKPGEVNRLMQWYDAYQESIKFERDRQRGQDLFKAAANEGPLGKYQEEMKELDYLHNYQRIGEEEYFFLRMKYVRDYYREAEGLDAQAIRKRLAGPRGEYQAGLANLRAHGEAAGLTPGEIEAEASRRIQDERKRLGISDTLGDFARDLAERRGAMADGTITQGEFGRWLTRRRRSAVDELTGETPDIRLNAAMASGGAEAHSVISRAATADPRVKAAVDAAAALNRIERLLEAGRTISEQQLRAMREAIL